MVEIYDFEAAKARLRLKRAERSLDRANELLQLLVARYTFAANAQVIRADAQMSASLLNITA